jgi:hypothetical protein
MAKRRPSETADDFPAPQASDTVESQETTVPEADVPADPLMDEIQTFMTLRDELARKLAAEIEATEQKLAELRETAASLFPQEVEDKKAKKPKTKPAKPEKSNVAAAESAPDGD